jgi:hypothetical protein
MNCIVRHLRKTNQCPTCRGATHANSNVQNAFVGSIGGLNLNFSISMDIPEETEQEELVEARSAPFWNTLETLTNLRQRDPQIKRRRHEMNLELREY